MIRSSLFNASRAFSKAVPKRPTPMIQNIMRSSINNQQQSWKFQAIRCYASSGGLSKDEVSGRILELLKNFDKVKDIAKLTDASHFNNDLGLDSLDTVEVVMAIEEEFGIEMPDKDADNIHSVDQAITYILSQPDAH